MSRPSSTVVQLLIVSGFTVQALSVFLPRCAGAQDTRSHLDIVAEDGAKLRATLYSAGKPGPGMLLLHQCNMDRQSWDALATTLAQQGIHALTFDYRGYGESPRSSDNRRYLTSDIDSALAMLIAQPGVDKQRIGAAGASCGVNNAIQLARRSGQIKALFLLSGPTTPGGLAYLSAQPDMPIFAAASTAESPETHMRPITATSTNPATVLRVMDKPGHGVPLFREDPQLLPTVVNWIRTQLR
ncbi:MAG: alpha/beta fold hydrolase [Gemmatimonadota bacterium]